MTSPTYPPDHDRVLAPARPRVARVISRLNIGGPAIQAISLTRHLESRGYESILLRGRERRHEGNMDHLARALGVHPVQIPTMYREIGPGDLLALLALARHLWRFRPDVVHTHAAKAGVLGRLAALALGRRRPHVIVHTFHGHSLQGYFSPRTARVLLAVERWLARRTTCIVAVSDEVRDDLVRMGVAAHDDMEVIRLGFDLSPFTVPDPERRSRREALRSELGIGVTAAVVLLVARLVPIKRVDRFLRVAERLLVRPDIRFVVAGDGELGDRLRRSSLAARLAGRVVWAGFRTDMPDLMFASDVVVQTSDNEGTPVSLIEAQAAGAPVVSTRVGGVATVVDDGVTGYLVDREDEGGFARRVDELLDDPTKARRFGRSGRRHALRQFGQERLIDDIDRLYRRLLTVDDHSARLGPRRGNPAVRR